MATNKYKYELTSIVIAPNARVCQQLNPLLSRASFGAKSQSLLP